MKRRADVVYLDLAESACNPLGGCVFRVHCARNIAYQAHDKNRPLADHSTAFGYGGWCHRFLDASLYRDPPETETQKAHQAIGSGFE